MPIINCFAKKKELILIDLEINLKPIGFCLKIALGKRMFDVAQGKARVEAQTQALKSVHLACARIIQALFLVLLIYGQVWCTG